MNAANPKEVKEAELKEKRGRARELEDVRFLLSTIQGRRFFWRYLGLCGLFRTSWEPSAKIHFNEGLRSASLMMLSDITEANEDAFLAMMKESKSNGGSI